MTGFDNGGRGRRGSVLVAVRPWVLASAKHTGPPRAKGGLHQRRGSSNVHGSVLCEAAGYTLDVAAAVAYHDTLPIVVERFVSVTTIAAVLLLLRCSSAWIVLSVCRRACHFDTPIPVASPW